MSSEKYHFPTVAESILWHHTQHKQLLGFKFLHQHTIGRFVVDFYCAEANLVIELDHPWREYKQAYDTLRMGFLNAMGLTVLIFESHDVIAHTHGVITALTRYLQQMPPRNVIR